MKDIFVTKKRSLLLEGKQKEVHDEELTKFLKNEVQILWPEGWMSVTSLKKLCTSFTEARKPDDKHSTNNTLNLSQNNCNLSIIPLNSTIKTNNNIKIDNNVANDLTVSKINNNKTVESGTSQKETIATVTSAKKDIPESRVISSFDIKKLLLDDNKKSPPPPPPAAPPQQVADNTVIVVNTNHNSKEEVNRIIDKSHTKTETNTVIEAPHCQVIDLTEPESRKKPGPKCKTNKIEDPSAMKALKLIKEPSENSFLNSTAATSEYIDKFFREVKPDIEVKRKPGPKSRTKPLDEPVNYHHTSAAKDYFADLNKLTVKHPELSVTPNYYNNTTTGTTTQDYANARNDGDDIQKVMENLKALQKLSSPIKSETTISSPVSVIAFNKNFTQKSNSNSNQSSTSQQPQQRTDFTNKGDFTSSFQDEFQKQLFNSMNQLTPTSSKTNYNRCS